MTRWLPESLARRLALEAPDLRALIEQLDSPRAPSRLAALDAVLGRLLAGDRVAADAERALPYVLGLAAAAGYPQSAALLTRVAHLLAVIDAPPRSLAGDAGREDARRAYDAVGESASTLEGLARGSGDPTVARLAAALTARFPDRDATLSPVLIALASGAPDADERAPLLYALARIQTSAGAPLHRRLAEALRQDPPGAEAVAVALALLDADPPPHEVARLRAIVDAAPPGMADPRAYGRRFGG